MCYHDHCTQSVLLERTYLQAVEPAHRVLLTVSVIETDLLSVFVTLASTKHQEKRTYLVDVCCTLCILNPYYYCSNKSIIEVETKDKYVVVQTI